MKSRTLTGTILLLLLLLAVWVQSLTVSAQDKVKPAPVAVTTDPAYVIGPEDVISVNVWKEPDMSGPVPVRPDGKISMPLLNDIQAAGLTATQLSAQITEQLKKYIEQPRVTIVVTQVNSQRYFVMGEVLHAGVFPLVPNMRVLQGLSGAGGFSPFANLKKIYVLRTEDGKQNKLPFNYREVVKGRNPEQNVVLKPGDTIVVP